MSKIVGVVYDDTHIREGKNEKGREVVELKFNYKKIYATTKVVIVDRQTATDLAFSLIDMLLYGGYGD